MMLTRSMQVLIVLGTCFVVLRTRLLASYHVMPLNKLLLVGMQRWLWLSLLPYLPA